MKSNGQLRLLGMHLNYSLKNFIEKGFNECFVFCTAQQEGNIQLNSVIFFVAGLNSKDARLPRASKMPRQAGKSSNSLARCGFFGPDDS